MPKKHSNRKTFNKRKNNSMRKKYKGGGIIKTPTCAQQVDITKYTRACGSTNQLPLDGIFQKHFPQQGGSTKNRRKNKTRRKKTKRKLQKGSGFSILPDVNIGNLPEIKGYSDCCPPVFLKDGPVWSNNQSLCNKGGGKKKQKVKRNIKKRKSRQSGGNMKNGNFSPDMSTREFNCRQPDWNPNCV